MNYTPISSREEEIASAIVDAAYSVHSNLGPGLLEPIYEYTNDEASYGGLLLS